MNSAKLSNKANIVIIAAFFCIGLDGQHELYGETNKMLLMIPPLLAKKSAEGPLSGYWYYTHNGYELNMSQNGDQLSATYTDLSGNSIFSIGDQAIKGTLKDKIFTGKIHERFSSEIKESCPNNSEIWGDINLTLSDDRKSLEGKYKTYTIYPSDCHIEDGSWNQISLTKKFIPLSNPLKSIEVKDVNVSLGVIVEAKDKRGGLLLSGKKDATGDLTQITDITYFKNTDTPEGFAHIHFDYEQKRVKAITSDEDFFTLDNYNPSAKTVSAWGGKINPDGTEQVNFQQDNIPVDEKEIFDIDNMITGWYPEAKGKAKAILKVTEELAPLGIKLVIREMNNSVQGEISKQDQCVIDKVTILSKFKDGIDLLGNFIRDIFLLKMNIIDFIKNQTAIKILEKILNPDDGAQKTFQTCSEVCCYQLQALCRKYGDEMYSTQCTCTILTDDAAKKAQIIQECESIGGVSESVGDFVWCKQWDLEPPSTCENQ